MVICFSLLVFSVEEKMSHQFHAQSDLSYNDSKGASHFDGDDDNSDNEDDDYMYALNEDRGCWRIMKSICLKHDIHDCVSYMKL